MNRYALDANIISYLLKGNEHITKRLDKEVSSGNEVAIPPIAYYEVKRGLLAANASTKLRIFMEFCFENAVGDIDRKVLDAAADIHTSLRCAGRGTEDADILIAAFCITNNYILVTHNVRHFENIDGLQIEDWAE